MKVYVFGNEMIEDDNLAIKVAKQLEIDGVDFEIVQDINEIIQLDELGDFVMMDVAKGIDDVKVLTNPEKIENESIYSLHDFDLGYFLKLKHALGHINHIRLIALPIKGDKDKIKKKAAHFINEMKKSSE